MRKAIIFALAAFIVLSAALCTVYGAVDGQKDAVVINQNVIWGDAQAAEGLAVKMLVSYQQHMYWDVLCLPGRQPEVTTEFSFYSADQPSIFDRNYSSYIQSLTNISMSTSGGSISLEDEEHYFMLKAAKDVAARTGNGEVKIETVRLSDYYDFYYLSFDLNPPQLNRYSYLYAESALKQLNDFFKIPVLPDHTQTITITKDSAGNITDVEIDSENEMSLSAFCTFVNDGLYVAFSALYWDNHGEIQAADTSHIPGGYGIYYIRMPDTEGNIEISNVYPIKQDTGNIVELCVSDDNKNLLMFSDTTDSAEMLVIDLETMSELQQIDIPYGESSDRINYVWMDDDDLIVTLSSGSFLFFYQDDNGLYRQFGSSPLTVGNNEEILRSFSFKTLNDFAFDGNRLALCLAPTPYYNCDFIVAVFDSEGLLYSGQYTNSLDAGASNSGYSTNLSLDKALEISFE